MTIKSGTTLLLRLGLLALCLAVPQLARAQEPAKPADPPDPDKVTPSYQAFDVLYNSFDVSMAEFWVAKSPSADSRIGYKIRTTFGSAADIMASASGQFPGNGDSGRNLRVVLAGFSGQPRPMQD
jgi:hypothetical protein